jgi:phage host-nuclease inhibitor protein Gam
MADDEQQDEAARAFEDLAAEVRVMRRAIEALEAKKPVDYAPTLAALTQELERLTAATANMARAPALKLTPDNYAAQVRRAAEDAARPAVAELQRVQALSAMLERALGGVKTRKEQRRQLLRVTGGALAAGVLLCVLLLPPITRALPREWHVPEKLAAGVVGADRWAAGQRMMEGYAPAVWGRITSMARLEMTNRKVLNACTRNAQRSKQAQRCAIWVEPL